MDATWSRTPDEVLQHFSVNEKIGLSCEQAATHAQLYGKNRAHLVQLPVASLND